jgi:multidrug resistance efflux pump
MENDLQALMDDQKQKATLLKDDLVSKEDFDAVNEDVEGKNEAIAQVDKQIDAVQKQLVQGHQFEEVQSLVKQIQAAEDVLQQISQHIADLLLVAPRKGTVKEIMHFSGERVTILEPLLTIDTGDN